MYIAYILKSAKTHRYYIGHTKDIENRLGRHNAGFIRSTKVGVPWKLILVEYFETKSQAYRRELQIKSYKGGEAFKKLIKK